MLTEEERKDLPEEETADRETAAEQDAQQTAEETAGTAEPETEQEADKETEEPEKAEPEKAEPGKTAKKKFWKSKDKASEPDERDKKIAELTDQYKRTMAEFDNFRKRTEKEKAARFDMGIRSVAEKILPVVDNFERGIAGLTEEQKADAFAAGMIKTYKQMTDVLEQIGIVPIEALGKPFNPDLHNAVMHIEDETVDENTVVEEFQKGYTYNGTVVRYSMVKVAN